MSQNWNNASPVTHAKGKEEACSGDTGQVWLKFSEGAVANEMFKMSGSRLPQASNTMYTSSYLIVGFFFNF